VFRISDSEFLFNTQDPKLKTGSFIYLSPGGNGKQGNPVAIFELDILVIIITVNVKMAMDIERIPRDHTVFSWNNNSFFKSR
jgi:hypothetical protein